MPNPTTTALVVTLSISDTRGVPLADAPALAAAAESQDPLIAAASPGELSAPLVEMLAHTPDTRVSIFPVLAGERVAALVYCWGTVQVAALELLAQVGLSPRTFSRYFATRKRCAWRWPRR